MEIGPREGSPFGFRFRFRLFHRQRLVLVYRNARANRHAASGPSTYSGVDFTIPSWHIGQRYSHNFLPVSKSVA